MKKSLRQSEDGEVAWEGGEVGGDSWSHSAESDCVEKNRTI